MERNRLRTRNALKFKLLWIKRYFDTGLGLTNYFKYIIAFFGIFNLIDAKTGILIVLFYIIFCFIIGYAYIKYKFMDVENEISNLLNPFQREVRHKLKVFSKSKKFK